MNITVEWENEEKRLIVWRMKHGFTWVEFDAAVDESARLMDTVTHRVDLLAVPETPLLPSVDAMGHFRYSVTRQLKNHNGGCLVVVGGGNLTPILLRFLQTSIAPWNMSFRDVKFFDSEARARAFIAQQNAPGRAPVTSAAQGTS